MAGLSKGFIKKRLFIAVFSLFICFQLTIFVLMHFTDILPSRAEFFACAAAFVFAVAFVLLRLWSGDFDKRSLFVAGGLFLAAVSDVFLVVLFQTLNHNELYLCFGVSFFVLAQLCYAAFIHGGFMFKHTRLFKADLIIRGSLTAFMLVLTAIINGLVLKQNMYLMLISIVYASQLCTNIVFAAIKISLSLKSKRNPPSRTNSEFSRMLLFLSGLVLLLLCDIFLCCGFFGAKFPINFEWLFYLPSMTVLTCACTLGIRYKGSGIR